MTSEQDQARLLAERIARRVSASSQERAASSHSSQGPSEADLGAELAAMRAGLDDLRQKLVQIESRLTHDESQHASSAHASQPALRLSGMYVPTPHPSEEKFGVEEATVAELVDYFEGTKKCDLEPGGKPCDHCAMCSSRGF
jgi:hypothetical protein